MVVASVVPATEEEDAGPVPVREVATEESVRRSQQGYCQVSPVEEGVEEEVEEVVEEALEEEEAEAEAGMKTKPIVVEGGAEEQVGITKPVVVVGVGVRVGATNWFVVMAEEAEVRAGGKEEEATEVEAAGEVAGPGPKRSMEDGTGFLMLVSWKESSASSSSLRSTREGRVSGGKVT